MLFNLLRGQRARNPSRAADRPSLADARLKAWALSVGDIRTPDGTRDTITSTHRGMLPDVDFAIVQPDPNRRSWRLKVAALLRRVVYGRNKPAVEPMAGLPPSALGETPGATYIDGNSADRSGRNATPYTDFPRAA